MPSSITFNNTLRPITTACRAHVYYFRGDFENRNDFAVEIYTSALKRPEGTRVSDGRAIVALVYTRDVRTVCA